MGSRSHNADYLSASQKFGLVAGNFLLTPLLGAVFYYAWRKDFPKSAKFANRSAWLCFGGIILLSILWNTILANKVAGLLGGVAKNSELAAIATEDREAMTKLYDDIQAYELDENSRVAVIVYPPLNPFFVFNDDAASALGELRKLKVLRLPMMSQLGDLGFGKIAQLAELEQLSISGSEGCTDEGLQALGELRNLKQLGVAMTGIGTLGTSAIGELEALEFLDLTATTVGDAAISELSGLTNLTSLALVGTKITDEALKTLAELPALRELDIRGCNVGDKGMSYLAASKTLESLEAFRTGAGGGLITDEGLANLSRLATLKYVNLSGNKISGAAVSSLKEALPNVVVEYEQVKPESDKIVEKAKLRPSEPREFEGIRITQELPPGSGIEKDLRLAMLSFKKGRPGRKQLLYMWTNEAGQPLVFSESFAFDNYLLNFSSASGSRLTATLNSRVIWQSERGGLNRKQIPNDAAVANEPVKRREQMRALASKFTARADFFGEFEPKIQGEEFYRFASSEAGVEDGAVFLMEAVDANPEVVLLLEARRDSNQSLRWYFALLPLGSAEFKVAFDGEQVWHSPFAPRQGRSINEPYFLTVNQYRAETLSESLTLSNLSQLQALDLRDSSIVDQDLARLADSHQLRHLNLDGTNVGSEILEELGDVKLTKLGIGVDVISDEDLRLLSNFKDLEWLSLNGAPITDAGVAHLLKLPKLKTLDISGTQISVDGIRQLQSLAGLSRLNLSRIEVTKELIGSLAAMPALKELVLSHTQLGDQQLDLFSELKSLQRLNLENTLVTELGYRRLSNALPECEIVWGLKHNPNAIPVQIAARHKDRAERYRDRKDWENTRLELEASIAAFADYAPNWMELLDILYWEDASFASRNEIYNKAQKALTQESDQLKVLFFHAGWSLLSDQHAKYEELCKEALERFSNSEKPQVQALLSWLLALHPSAKTSQPLEFASRAKQNSTESDTRAALAISLIRSGRSEDAIEHCENELERSLAFLRMNDLRLAREAFAKFRASHQKSTPKLSPQIHQRLAQRIYLREVAEALEFGPINPKVERAIFSSPQNSLCLSYLPIGDAELPLHLDPLPDLEELHLVSTRVGNDGMAAVGRLEKLRLLELGETKIDSFGLDHLSNLKALEILTLHFTDFSDTGVQHLLQLPRLYLVNVQGTNLTNRGITDLASIETLTWLNAGGTKATDLGYSELGKLRDLEFLFLSGSKLTDLGLEALAKLSKLKVLDVRNTQVTAQGIQRLRARLPGCNVLNNATVIPKNQATVNVTPNVSMPSQATREKINRAFSDWMTDRQYQRAFQEAVAKGQFPESVEGRNQSGTLEFRAKFVPLGSYQDFYAHHGLSEPDFQQKQQEYIREGYGLLSQFRFKNQFGRNLICATWVKKPANPVVQQTQKPSDPQALQLSLANQFVSNKTTLVPAPPVFDRGKKVIVSWREHNLQFEGGIEKLFPDFMESAKEQPRSRRVARNFSPELATAMESMDDFQSAMAEARRRKLIQLRVDANDPRQSAIFDQTIGKVDSLADLIKKLEKNSNPIVIGTIGLFGPAAADAAPRIAEIAANSEGGIRAECAQALANIGSASIPQIKKLLVADADVNDKRFALAVAGLLGKHAESLLPEIAALLDDGNKDVTDGAFWCLAYLLPEFPKAYELLVPTLSRNPIDDKAIGTSYQAGTEAVDFVIQRLNKATKAERTSLIFLLGLIGDERTETLDVIAKYLDDQDTEVKKAASLAAGAMGSKASRLVPNLVQNAVREIPRPADFRVPEQRIAYTNSRNVQKATWEALASIGVTDSTSLELVVDFLLEDADSTQVDHWVQNFKTQAAYILGRSESNSPQIMKALVQFAKNRQSLAPERDIVNLSGTSRIRIRSTGFGSGSTRLPATVIALRALAELGDASDATLKVVRQCLSSNVPFVRATAVRTLQKLGRPPENALDICMGVLESSQNPSVYSSFEQNLCTADALVAVGEKAIQPVLQFARLAQKQGYPLFAAVLVLGRIGEESLETRAFLTQLEVVESRNHGTLHEFVQIALRDLDLTEEERVSALLHLLEQNDQPSNELLKRIGACGAQASTAIPKLIELMQNEDNPSRLETLKALRVIAPKDPQVVASIQPLLEDKNRQVGELVFAFLCEAYPVSAGQEVKLVEFARKNSFQIPGVEESLFLLGEGVVLPIVIEGLESDLSYSLLLRSLLRKGFQSDGAIQRLAGALKSPNVEVRRAISEVLLMRSSSNAEAAKDELIVAASDEDARVAWNATKALIQLLPLAEVIAAVPLLEETSLEFQVVERFIDTMRERNKQDQGVLDALRSEREKRTNGYWLRQLQHPNPERRIYVALTFFNYFGPSQELLDSVVNDKNASPKAKQIAEQILSQQRRVKSPR